MPTMPIANQSTTRLAHFRIPTLTAEPWRCRACGCLLGIERGGELHVKVKELNQWITGRCRHVCRRCGAMNTVHTVPTIHASALPCPAAAAEGEGR